MIFGEGLQAATSAEPAAWLEETLSVRQGTVGGLLPRHYERYLLVEPAPPEAEDWWRAQSEIVSKLAEVLVDFTTTPARAWFAIWEGHGFEYGTTNVYFDPAIAVDPEEVRAARAAAAEEDTRRTVFVREALAGIPRVGLTDRTYYLLTGNTLAVAALQWPTEPTHWFRPDLWWPEDRSWFVGTDVDIWCNYIGGTEAAIAAIAARLPTQCRPATLGDRLPIVD